MKALPVELLNIDDLEVPECAKRETGPGEDEKLRRSIRIGGVQEPLVVVIDGERRLVAKGGRRARICRELGIPKVRCMIDRVPAGMTAESYIRRIRFILHEHRQDPIPSVRAGLIVKLKEQLGLNNAQVAAYLGIDQDTITNWLAVLRYVPEVVSAIDAGALTMDAARVFSGMSDEGQRAVWKKHGSEMLGTGKGGVHKRIRSLYTPAKFPGYYKEPEKIAARLGRAKGKRRSRVSYTADEKKRMLASVEVKEAEREELDAEAKTLKRQCVAAGPVIAAILRHPKTRALVPKQMLPELERFAEIY